MSEDVDRRGVGRRPLNCSRSLVTQFREDQLQYLDRTRLIQRIVTIAALGGLHTRRTAPGAFARLDGGRRRAQPGAGAAEGAVGESPPARVPVVDEDTGQAG